jgi:hypothetical protein
MKRSNLFHALDHAKANHFSVDVSPRVQLIEAPDVYALTGPGEAESPRPAHFGCQVQKIEAPDVQPLPKDERNRLRKMLRISRAENQGLIEAPDVQPIRKYERNRLHKIFRLSHAREKKMAVQARHKPAHEGGHVCFRIDTQPTREKAQTL